MKLVLMNTVFYTFLGLTAYFVTPHVLWTLLVIQGFVDQNQETKSVIADTIKEGNEND